MLKVEVPFGGENAKFGYKDGIFYYLIIFVYSGNVCGYKARPVMHITFITSHYFFYVTGCSTTGIVPCVAHFNCNTGSNYVIIVSREWLSRWGKPDFLSSHLLLLQYFTPYYFRHPVFKTKEVFH